MANALNRNTLEHKRSVHSPDFDPTDWIINPNLLAVTGVPKKYWRISGDTVSEMTQVEKDAVDAGLLAAAKSARITQLQAEATEQIAIEMIDSAPGAKGRFVAAQNSVNNASTIEEIQAVKLEKP